MVDIDKASGDFVDFLDDIKRLSSGNENWGGTDEGRQLVVSNILTSTLQAGLGIRDTSELSSIYKSLMQTWMVPMSRGIPGRVRIAFEKSLRDLACRICLASHAIRVDSGAKAKEGQHQQKSSDAGARFVLPVRRRTSVTSLGKGKTPSDALSSPPPASSQISEDAGFMNSSAFEALPTPEATPSLRSRSSVSSLAGSEDPASQRLRAYANLAPQPGLPAKMSNLLDYWQLGVDPAKYNWEAAQQANATDDGIEDESRRKQRQRQERKLKRQRESTVEPSLQRTPKRLGDSQPQQGQDAQAMQGSSQQTEKAVTMSQVQPGKFGGRHAKTKKPRVLKPRPAGFK